MNKKNVIIATSVSLALITGLAITVYVSNDDNKTNISNEANDTNINIDFKNKTSFDMRDYYTEEGLEFIKKILPDSTSSDFALLNVGKQLSNELAELKFTTVNNNEVKLKDLAGKKVVIDFALANCGTCAGELNFMSNYNFKSNDIEYLHIFPRDTTSDVKELYKENNGKFNEDHIVTSSGLNGFKFEDLSITNVPAKLFIDEEGTVQYAYVGGFTDEETLQLHLERAFDKDVPKMLDFLK